MGEGHYYNADVVGEDPWQQVGYMSTNEVGYAEFVDCVATGETEFESRAWLIHAEDGSRVSCGLLEESASLMTPDDQNDGKGKGKGKGKSKGKGKGGSGTPYPTYYYGKGKGKGGSGTPYPTYYYGKGKGKG